MEIGTVRDTQVGAVRDVEAFERLISHARFATERYRDNTMEANKALRAFLLLKLQGDRKINASSYVDWN